ncbi:hypothetical protein EHS13_32710 [Paenibacillus psychroresistens]|uniref:DUF2178 domain-containing protein n=1 Tax=Paenibacillus psychroresistens TaxID=1778678 RepID=A0A6B8RVX6_9BACL|nr:hypothetical protein [Paenibacillus psychroresistens]QGQ99288.1 hypothetical protein EHS13_32710 [Paenibacillus psychroresistens]
MSYQEKKNVVSLISTTLVFGFYCLYIFQKYQDVGTDYADILHFWGVAILILIPISIVAKIIISIVFNIINRITTNEKEPAFADELDKLIELKATRSSHAVFTLGFVIAMGSLVMDMTPSAMFIIILFSGFISEVVGVITRLYHYRRGV